MKPIFSSVALTFACIMAPAVVAQDAPTVTIPADSMSCLVANQDKYLDFPRNVLIFFAEFCPALSREEVAHLIQNSADDAPEAVRLLMSKNDFRCLLGKIGEYQSAAPQSRDSADAGEFVDFVLDCN
jgi:hypothetical protein